MKTVLTFVALCLTIITSAQWVNSTFCNKNAYGFITRPLCGILFLTLLIPFLGLAQVGINTTQIDHSAVLQIQSSDKGVLLPSLTIEQREAIITNAANAGVIVPPGLTIFCTDCCQNGTGSLFYYNGVEWRPLDSTCRDLNAAPNCINVAITSGTDNNHLTSESARALLIDGAIDLVTQNQEGSSEDLRLHKFNENKYINFNFPQVIPSGYIYRIYFNDSQQQDKLGLIIRPYINDGDTSQDVNTFTPALNGGSLIRTGRDFVYTNTLTSDIDQIRVFGGGNKDHIYLLEIKLFDNNDVEIPLTCN